MKKFAQTSQSSSLPMMIMAFLILPILLSAPDVQAESKSGPVGVVAHFESAFDAFSATNPVPIDWLQPASPWAPLLSRQFFGALGEKKREHSLNAQRLGQCEPVISGDLRGFIDLYPDLQAIMLRHDIRANFETILLPQFSHALKRCRAFEQLIPIIEATRRHYSLDETFAVALPQAYIFRRPPIGASKTMHSYNQAVGEIYRLGLCQGFTPALNDIVWFETEIRTHQISLEDLAWLERKFPKTSRMRRKLENWRQYVEGLEQANSRRVMVERLKQEAGRMKISRQMPRVVRDFCKKNEIKKTGNH